MKISSVCFALVILLSYSSFNPAVAQETENDQKIAEMQTTIANLQAELESMKNMSTNEPTLRAPVAPVPRPNWHNYNAPPAPSDRYQSEYDRRYERAPGDSSYYQENQQRSAPRSYYQQPPVVERVVIPQPLPVIFEPSYYPRRSYGTSSNGGLYIGPNGWGFGVGGLQFNFSDYGHHGSHGGGHYSHKGHKGHKGHK